MHDDNLYSNKYDNLKVLSTLPQPMPMLVPTQHHPLKMPMQPTFHVLPTPPMPQPNIIPNEHTASHAPHGFQSSVNTSQQTSNRNCAMPIEMTTMSRQPQRGTEEDKSELAGMQIANARRRQRAAISSKTEQECRADNPNIFNNVVYEPNTKTFVVHERRTKSYQQKRKSDQH